MVWYIQLQARLVQLIAGVTLHMPGFNPRLICGVYGGQCAAGTGFPPSTEVFPHQYYSTDAHLSITNSI